MRKMFSLKKYLSLSLFCGTMMGAIMIFAASDTNQLTIAKSDSAEIKRIWLTHRTSDPDTIVVNHCRENVAVYGLDSADSPNSGSFVNCASKDFGFESFTQTVTGLLPGADPESPADAHQKPSAGFQSSACSVEPRPTPV